MLYESEDAAIGAVREGKSFVDCSTLRVKDMVFTAGEIQKRGGRFLEAPVSGSKGPAEGGTLLFLCAGDRMLFEHAVTQRALELMGKKSFFLGEVGNGTRMKVRFLSVCWVFFLEMRFGWECVY